MTEFGRVIGVKAGKFFVKTDEIREYTAKGAMKIKSDGIVVGDAVEVSDGVIKGVLPRKNMMKRPAVANVDIAVVVIADTPKPDYYLTDKFIANCRMAGIPVAIAVNKSDNGGEIFKDVKANYDKSAERVFSVSAKTKDGLKEFTDYLSGKLAVFTGQSAVGKTSMVNAIFGECREVGETSRKTGRGRQTTTATEIIEKDGLTVVDTPGFSALDLELIKDEIIWAYPEFFGRNCRYVDCRHIGEPDCGVRDAVSRGEIFFGRYERYLKLYAQAKDKRYELKKKRENSAVSALGGFFQNGRRDRKRKHF